MAGGCKFNRYVIHRVVEAQTIYKWKFPDMRDGVQHSTSLFALLLIQLSTHVHFAYVCATLRGAFKFFCIVPHMVCLLFLTSKNDKIKLHQLVGHTKKVLKPTPITPGDI